MEQHGLRDRVDVQDAEPKRSEQGADREIDNRGGERQAAEQGAPERHRQEQGASRDHPVVDAHDLTLSGLGRGFGTTRDGNPATRSLECDT